MLGGLCTISEDLQKRLEPEVLGGGVLWARKKAGPGGPERELVVPE